MILKLLMMMKRKIASGRVVVPLLLLPDADTYTDPDDAHSDADANTGDDDPDADDEEEHRIMQSGCSAAVAA